MTTSTGRLIDYGSDTNNKENTLDGSRTVNIARNPSVERSLSILRTLSNEHIERERKEILHGLKEQPLNNNSNNIKEKILQSSSLFNKRIDDSSKKNIMGNNQSSKEERDWEYGDTSYFSNEDGYNAVKKENLSISKKSRSSKSLSRGESGRSNRSSSKNLKKKKTVDDLLYDDEAQQYYTLDELVDKNIYKVRQSYGTLSIGFAIVQTIILAAMMIMCSVAPLNVNPMIGPYPDALDYWGAKNAYKILDNHEWWRYVSPLFLHGGIIHLVCNISVQVDIGAFFEREWGSRTWLFIYLASGIGSSILSCVFNPDNISVGSSGAVMGLFGAKLAEIFCRACESTETKAARIGYEVRKEQLTQSLCSVILVLAFSFIPYVDWAAHLGGVISGFTAGFLCFPAWIEIKYCSVIWYTIGVGMNLFFYLTCLVYLYTEVEPNENLADVCAYYQQYFEDYECNCQI